MIHYALTQRMSVDSIHSQTVAGVQVCIILPLICTKLNN